MIQTLLLFGSISMTYGLVRMILEKIYPPAHVCVLSSLALAAFSLVYLMNNAWIAALLTSLQSLCWLKLGLRGSDV